MTLFPPDAPDVRDRSHVADATSRAGRPVARAAHVRRKRASAGLLLAVGTVVALAACGSTPTTSGTEPTTAAPTTAVAKQAGLGTLDIKLTIYNEDWQTIWATACVDGGSNGKGICDTYEINSGDEKVYTSNRDRVFGKVSYTKEGLNSSDPMNDPSFDGLRYEANNFAGMQPKFIADSNKDGYYIPLGDGETQWRKTAGRTYRFERRGDTPSNDPTHKDMRLVLMNPKNYPGG